METETITNDFRTVVNASVPWNSNSKMILSTILKTNPAITMIIPLIPVIPNPGMTNTSSAISIIPNINITISQFSANPSRYSGAK